MRIQLFVLLLTMIFFFGCKSSQKVVTQGKLSDQTKQVVKDEIKVNTSISIDTTKSSGKKIEYTKIEYFAPGKDSLKDSGKNKPSKVKENKISQQPGTYG